MFNFNITDAQGNPVSMKLVYGKAETIAFPQGAYFYERLNGEIAVCHNGKFFGKRYALMNSSGKLLTDFSFRKNDNGRKYFSVNDAISAIQNPNGKGYVLKDRDGNPISDTAYKSVKPLSLTRISASLIGSPKKFAMLDNSGKALTGFDYKKIENIDGDIYFAYADGDQVNALLEDGSVKFSLRCSEVRPYCDGYAVFTQGGLLGAIDKDGNIAVKPRFNWLSDCAFGLFRFCDVKQATNIQPMGVVNANDEIVIGTDKGLNDIELVSETVLKHHRTYVWNSYQGNQTITYTIKLTGFVLGHKIIPAKYFYLGTFGEDLRSFVSLELDDPKSVFLGKGMLKIGYEDINFKPIITLVSIRGIDSSVFQNIVLSKNFNDILSPFENETAVVKIKSISTYVSGGLWDAISGNNDININCEARLIDYSGTEINDPDLLSERLAGVKNISSNDPPAKPEAEILESEVTRKLRENGYTPKFTAARISCEMLVPYMWSVIDSSGNQKFVTSALETKQGFWCGLIQVSKNGLYGFADTNAEIIIEPIYDEVLAFENNVGFARKDKQWYILKRSCKIETFSDLIPPGEEILKSTN